MILVIIPGDNDILIIQVFSTISQFIAVFGGTFQKSLNL